jgi:hypothetical protein
MLLPQVNETSSRIVTRCHQDGTGRAVKPAGAAIQAKVENFGMALALKHCCSNQKEFRRLSW